jgi:hypothetical protein
MLDQGVILWGMHAGRTGDADHVFLHTSFAAIGWPGMGDLSALQPTREAFGNMPEARCSNNDVISRTRQSLQDSAALCVPGSSPANCAFRGLMRFCGRSQDD